MSDDRTSSSLPKGWKTYPKRNQKTKIRNKFVTAHRRFEVTNFTAKWQRCGFGSFLPFIMAYRSIFTTFHRKLIQDEVVILFRMFIRFHYEILNRGEKSPKFRWIRAMKFFAILIVSSISLICDIPYMFFNVFSISDFDEEFLAEGHQTIVFRSLRVSGIQNAG